jgi:hypothetical protein
MRSLLLATFIATAPSLISACEGECIVGITNAWLSNYTIPINQVFGSLVWYIQHLFIVQPFHPLVQANQVVERLIPEHARADNPMDYLDPILDLYSVNAYIGMEHAIFPSFFHGKCQNPKTGINPPGCPNPDCAVVCGTPGSLVHFYPHLRYIAFNQTRHALRALAAPGAEGTRAVEDLVLPAALKPEPRHLRRLEWSESEGQDQTSVLFKRRDERTAAIKVELHRILAQIGPLLEQACGGSGKGQTNGLPSCSWETRMKEYILTFP